MEDKPSGFPWYPSLLPTQSIVCIEEGVMVRDLTQWPSASVITGWDTDLPGETRRSNITPLQSVPSSTLTAHVKSYLLMPSGNLTKSIRFRITSITAGTWAGYG